MFDQTVSVSANMRVRRPASIDQADASWTRRQRTGPKIGRDRLTINITKHDYVEKTSKPKQAEPIGPTHKVVVTLTVTGVDPWMTR